MDAIQTPCPHCGVVNEVFEKRGTDYNPLCAHCRSPLRPAREPRLVHYGGGLYIQHIPGKGLGVFSRAHLKEGMLVERCAAYVLDTPDMPLERVLKGTALHPYVNRKGVLLKHMLHPWREDDIRALVLGNGMLYNHAPWAEANMRCKPYVEPDTDRRYMDFFATKDVTPGTELTVTYTTPDQIWFRKKKGP